MIDRLTLVDEPVIPRGPTMPMAVTMDPVETMPGIPAVPPPQAEPAMPVPAPSPPHIPMKPASPKAVIEDEDVLIKPPTNEVFKQSSFRPPTQGGRISRGVDVRPPGTADARLKYTKSPFVNGGSSRQHVESTTVYKQQHFLNIPDSNHLNLLKGIQVERDPMLKPVYVLEKTILYIIS
ncbi:uncharacterized protein LOC124289422 [Haliotis rubra]|uniref:uncharacterized protein LOC124289422 n=1 Tax=Haliotis rubra TaxID=36100 RepID=UPI001EE5E7D6|nr:uncharacterized protein LOC124289422 [Haliotis rubra]